MKNYSKLFKIIMLVLLVVSVAILVWGFAVGFTTKGGQAVDVLLYWGYCMVALAVIAVVLIGLIISAGNNPKSLIKLAVGIVGVVAVCAAAYVLAPGAPALGMLEQPSEGTLKLTDTILNLTYLAAGAAVVAIVIGEIVMAVRNKK